MAGPFTQTVADGQLATSATSMLAGSALATGHFSLSLCNTSGSLTQTVLLTMQRNGGTARRIARFVLAPNEWAQLNNYPMDSLDTLLGSTTTAATVDYMIGSTGNGPMEAVAFDANGSAKQTNGTSLTGATTITSTSADSFDVGPNGATNPALKVDGSVASEAGGLQVQGQADAAGVYLTALGSNTNEPLAIDAKGTGKVIIGGNATGGGATGGALVRTAVSTVAAANNAIGNATAVLEGFVYVTGANGAGNNAARLPASTVGKRVKVKNTVANAVLVIFPPASSQINANGVNNAYNIAAGATREFTCVTTTLWYTDPETIA